MPLFFVIISFCFFSKLTGTKADNALLKGFLKRNFLLYLFWNIVYAPFTIALNVLMFSDGIKNLVVSFFLGHAYVASWFLPALMICVTGTFLTRRLPIWLQILGGAVTYAMCMLHTNYTGLLPHDVLIWKVLNHYSSF